MHEQMSAARNDLSCLPELLQLVLHELRAAKLPADPNKVGKACGKEEYGWIDG